MENKRNYFIAIALSVLIVLAWQFFYMNPKIEAQRQEQARIAEQAKTAPAASESPAAKPSAEAQVSGALPASGQATATATREEAIAKTARVAIDTPALSGSINLTGARFDDLKLKGYRETVDPQSPIITLFSPSDTKDGYFAELGYVAGEGAGAAPGPSTVWTLAEGDKLTQATPVTLSFTNDAGLTLHPQDLRRQALHADRRRRDQERRRNSCLGCPLRPHHPLQQADDALCLRAARGFPRCDRRQWQSRREEVRRR